MRLEHGIIAVAMFFMVFTIGIGLYNNQITEYNLDDNTDKFNAILGNITAEDDIIRLRANTQSQDISIDDTESSLFKSNVPAIRDIKNPLTDITKLLNNINKETGLVPDFIINGFIWVIAALLLVFIVYMIMRFKPAN